ncbi:citrate:proton symporter, partial [Glutamicibacter creatinolyticus]
AALGVEATDIFVPMLPSLGVALVVVGFFAWQLGLSERRRLHREMPEVWGTEL